MEVEGRCVYCDHRFKMDEDDDYYRCSSCRLHNINCFIANKW